MTIDLILTVITLVVAVIGTLLKDPARDVKIFLISLAALASIASIYKSYDDSKEKEFLKRAITSNLVPDAGAYGRFSEQIGVEAKSLGFDDFSCFHASDTMTCFLSSTADSGKHGTLVLNRREIAEMYGNDLQRKSTQTVIQTALSHEYDPGEFQDEFEDKVAGLGAAVFFSTLGHWPNYSYDDHKGTDLRLVYESAGGAKEVQFTPADLKAVPKGKAADLFNNFEQQFRKRFVPEGSPAPAPQNPAAKQ